MGLDAKAYKHKNLKLDTSYARKMMMISDEEIIVYWWSHEEIWQRRTKYIVSKIAHWKIYSRIYQIFQEKGKLEYS